MVPAKTKCPAGEKLLVLAVCFTMLAGCSERVYRSVDDLPRQAELTLPFVYWDYAPRRMWMPNTYFDLDIFFLNKKLKVRVAERDMPHYPRRKISSDTPSTFAIRSAHVLEITSASNLAKELKPGDTLKWSSKPPFKTYEKVMRSVVTFLKPDVISPRRMLSRKSPSSSTAMILLFILSSRVALRLKFAATMPKGIVSQKDRKIVNKFNWLNVKYSKLGYLVVLKMRALLCQSGTACEGKLFKFGELIGEVPFWHDRFWQDYYRGSRIKAKGSRLKGLRFKAIRRLCM